MAEPQLTPEDVAIIQQLRTEWMNTLKEGIAIRDAKGYTDSECREKMDKSENP